LSLERQTLQQLWLLQPVSQAHGPQRFIDLADIHVDEQTLGQDLRDAK